MALLRVPKRMPMREMLIGTLAKLENVENILVIIEYHAYPVNAHRS